MTAVDTALLTGPAPKASPETPKIARVAREHGVSPLSQLLHMWRGRSKRQGLTAAEYYDFEVYKAPDKAARQAFVGVAGSRALNRRLSPAPLRKHDEFLKNKVACTRFLARKGLPTTQTQATVTTGADAGGPQVLRSFGDILRFLQEDAVYPLFAKPAAGSLSIGSARIERLDDETLHLGNGAEVSVTAFAGEILRDHAAQGFLFQSAVAQHPELTERIGVALGTVRVITAMVEAEAPDVLYVLWKIPSPDAMSDNFWQAGSMIAALDKDTGEVLSVRRGTGLESARLTHHPVTGAPLVGMRIPHWEQVKAVTAEAHSHFPAYGTLGWDVGIGADGPVIVECNISPFHTLYQLSTGEGLLNPRLAPVFDKIAARQAARAKAQ